MDQQASPAVLSALMGLIGEGVVIVDEHWRVHLATAPIAHFVGAPHVDALPKRFTDLVHHEDRSQLRAACERGGEVRVRAQRRDQSWACLHIRCLDRNDDPDIAGTVLVVRDTSDEVAAREKLAASLSRYREIVESAQGGVLVVDRGATVTLANSKAAEMLGERCADMVGRPLAEWVFPEDHVALDRAVERRRSGVSEELEFPMRRADSSAIWVLVATNPLYDDDGEYDGALAVLTDITERKQAERELAERVLLDPLTGLPNREAMTHALSAALSRTARHGGCVAVLYLDLDGFKPVNDCHGHATGDAALRLVAERLQQAVRTEDAIARVGGDEFVIVSEVSDGRRGPARMAEQLLRALTPPIAVDDVLFSISASIGVAVAESGLEEGEQLLADADAAMYEAKRAGRGGVRFAAPPAG